ncbi:5-formyltetrahydrofolate cyclo-ligase [Nibribacter ruber]|uniref:5-formyltetrahydrofolate cyclo-ligase n=1 Tax=Nibribacter ruber TaxID=2698458 RepID=A0A6P1P289_9BACT|nr:5-formyltetrahydrofolate cyclo-ligase [Nibribacter ruber]QHL88501.1 5-formyltetrahydrofolate cyclo-ligase [Nibribacter ruber]
MLKAHLRKAYLAKRRNLSEAEVEDMSLQIANRFFEDFQPVKGQTVHVFLPILHHREINTWRIIHKLWEQFPEVRVATSVSHLEDCSMTHFLITPETKLVTNRWGIPEPVQAQQITEQEIDLVLVPLLVFDLQGHRVGYGKGFYDRFLAFLPKTSQKRGLSLEPPVPKIEDVHPLDLILDAVITPQQTFWF